MDEIIKAENLTKTFGDFTAVDNLSLSVRRGEIFGFLGPNGAGKTTSIGMLTTMTRPNSGHVYISGYDAYSDYIHARRNIGIIPQHNSLDKDISVYENIKHHALMQNLPRSEIPERISELTNLMCLEEHMNKLVENLSGGLKKRVSIVCSMIHRPQILFMDEPTTGLDTQSRNLLWSIIRTLNKNGTTIFLTTHYMHEAEALCDRVGIINHGHLIALGTNDELREKIGSMTVEYIDDDQISHNTYFRSRAEAKEYAQTLSDDRNVLVRRTNLEDVFLELSGKKLS